MKQILTLEEVAKAIEGLKARGIKVTCTALHAALGNRGSMSTLLRLKSEVEGTTTPKTDSPDGLKAFRDLWELAVAEGRQLQEGTVVQLREELQALATENERLDGLAVEFQHATKAAEAERDRVLAEHRTLQGDLLKATAEAKVLLEKLADERGNHGKEMAAVRQRVHELELEVAGSKDNSAVPPRRRGRHPKQIPPVEGPHPEPPSPIAQVEG